MSASSFDGVGALTFDVFGTVVDWRSAIIRDGEELGRAKDIDLDWPAFADDWRALYQPAMERVRTGEIDWCMLDDLHRMNLDELLLRHGIGGLTEDETDRFNRVWHRLDPWPDVVVGLTRLKAKLILATLSNGNTALLVNMAKRAGLPWDAVLGAETAGAYKPQPRAYLRTAEMLGLAPERCMMVAAHNGDLAAAAALGFKTAFVRRPNEYGPEQTSDLEPEGVWDIVAEDFLELADKLGR
ncbi:MAG: (S)-2-haloacid dehalogenase 4A [Alphaproteobacteria bacterium MarineAlpha10_Bin2]|nr:MAG: (S)-2-haloacid dehalogenase 4A [Alphaproteobacteria bacterium MarineAlpha10_Bin2]